MKKVIPLFLIVSILLISSSISVGAEPVWKNKPTAEGPSLKVDKYISEDQLVLGNSLTVHVNITNWSDSWAYNLTIEEPRFNNFSVIELRDYEEYNYRGLGPDGSIDYQYTIKPRNTGNYTIEPTKVTFYNKTGTQFFAQSSFLPFDVFLEEVPEEEDILWENLLYMSLPFAVIPILGVITRKYFI